MRSITDTFIKHPVLAIVANLAILLVGWRTVTSLPVQQYPKIESSSVVITTVYYGASAEAVRGFLTTPIERAVSAIGGVDYVESSSRAGLSTITVHLKLNHSTTAALAEVTARLQQVRSELPAEAQPPMVEVQKADRPYASFYLSFTSSAREIPALTDWLTRNLQPQLTTLAGVQRVAVVGGRPPKDIDMQLAYDATVFMTDALHEISKTLVETILIVGLVVFLFMGSVRTALVPLVAMPVSLVGAGIVMYAFGFSLNLLTILAIVLSVGLVVDDAIVVVENVERHVREGKSRIQAALIGARELVGPIVAMTITLAAVYTPIGFQGGLTGSLFLEFAITLAAAVVVSGFVAVTLSPVMSSRFVNEKGREGRLTKLVHHGFEAVRRRYERLLDGALQMRWAIVAAAVLVMVAAVPLYQNSRRELAPIEDQSHISLFMAASPDASLEATNKASLQVVKAVTAFPEAKFMWSLTASWGGFGGMVAKNWKERQRTTEQMYGQVYGAVSQVPGLQVFPRLDPPLPSPGQYDVELILASDVPPEQMLQTVGAVLGAGWQSGKFLYVDTDLKIDLPEARVVIDRDQVADLGLDLASVGRELGTLLGGGYVNRFNYFDRSYKVIPQIGDERRTTVGPLLDLKIKTPSGRLVPVSTFTRIESTTAPRTLNRFQQRNAVRIFGGVKPGVTKEEGLRVLENAAAGVAGPSIGIDYAGESRQMRLEGAALTTTLIFAVILIYLVLAAQFRSFRDPLVVLVGSVPLAISGALVFSFLNLTTINIYSQVGLITLVGLIAKNGILIVQFANSLQAQGVAKLVALREASLTRLRPVLMTSAATVFGHLPLVFATGPGSAARNSIGTVLVAGMSVGTLFTLFVVPVFYSLIAAEHRPETEEASEGLVLEPAMAEEGAHA